MQLKIKLSRIWVVTLIAATAISYPVSTVAAEQLFEGRNFTAPFFIYR